MTNWIELTLDTIKDSKRWFQINLIEEISSITRLHNLSQSVIVIRGRSIQVIETKDEIFTAIDEIENPVQED